MSDTNLIEMKDSTQNMTQDPHVDVGFCCQHGRGARIAAWLAVFVLAPLFVVALFSTADNAVWSSV
ncbi:hypothetical protein ACOI1H_20245, partial [Loktanella sp. DJP18]|uniref:hypothetical protein n=1 Tax=Loktanella sp. DJP18 TaxID=3409788 RepID=UPI003BB64E4E